MELETAAKVSQPLTQLNFHVDPVSRGSETSLSVPGT